MLTIQNGYRPTIGYPTYVLDSSGNRKVGSTEPSFRGYGQPSVVLDVIAITSTTNTTPIGVVVASTAKLTLGDAITIAGHLVNTAANGTWKVSNLTGTTFELVTAAGANSVGNGVGGATGTISKGSGLFRSLTLPARVGPSGRVRFTLGLPQGT